MPTNKLFDTPDKINLAISSFKTLKDTVGWKLLEEIVEANIKLLEDQILNGFDEETKEQIDRKRDKLRAYKEIINTPDYWIKHLETPELLQQEEDPYYTVSSLNKEKKK